MSVSQRAVKIMNKLQIHGADSDRKVRTLTYPQIMDICRESKSQAFQDMESIVALQEAIRAGNVTGFMLGIKEDEEAEDAAGKGNAGSEESDEEVDADAETDEKEEDAVAGGQLHGGSGESEGTERVY